MSAFDARWKYWGKSEVSSFFISTEIRRAPIASLLIWQDHLTKVDIALLTTPKLERQKRNVFSFITDLPVLLEELSGCSEITVPSQYLGLGVLLLNCSNCSKTNPICGLRMGSWDHKPRMAGQHTLGFTYWHQQDFLLSRDTPESFSRRDLRRKWSFSRTRSVIIKKLFWALPELWGEVYPCPNFWAFFTK